MHNNFCYISPIGLGVHPKCVGVTVLTHFSVNETLPARLIHSWVKDNLNVQIQWVNDGPYNSEVCLTDFLELYTMTSDRSLLLYAEPHQNGSTQLKLAAQTDRKVFFM